MDKELTVSKWVLINQPKTPQNLSAQIVCSSQKVWDFDEKRLDWASVIHALSLFIKYYNFLQVCMIFGQNIAKIVSLLWKLANPNCHTFHRHIDIQAKHENRRKYT